MIIIYTDGLNEISEEEFFILQDRLCAGDPVALAYVLLNMKEKKLQKELNEENFNV